MINDVSFKIWRGNTNVGKFEQYSTDISDCVVVLDAVLKIQKEKANNLALRWNCKAGKCGSCSAEVNGNPKLMCMTRLNEIDTNTPVTVEPLKTFPLIKDLVTDVSWNFSVKKKIKKFKPRHPDNKDGSWTIFEKDCDRVHEFRK